MPKPYRSLFTPGPWWGERDGTSIIILAKQGPLRVSPGRASSEADAHLMVSAPDLHDALSNLMGLFDNAIYRRQLKGDEFYAEAIATGRAALAKARGEAS